jgi:hypothetical protein
MGRLLYLNIAVSSYSGYRANERPLAFAIEGTKYVVHTIHKKWYSPKGESRFDITTTSGLRFILIYDQRRDIWSAESKE